MRCPECSKFVSFDTENPPEVSNLEISSEGQITGEVRIALPCAECSTELKQHAFDVSHNITIDHETGDDHILEIEGDAEPNERGEGAGRFRKTFYGFTLTCLVTCACGELEIDVEPIEDFIQASSMEELT